MSKKSAKLGKDFWRLSEEAENGNAGSLFKLLAKYGKDRGYSISKKDLKKICEVADKKIK